MEKKIFIEEEDPLDIKPIMQEIEEYIVLEEDPEIYAMAGMELVPVTFWGAKEVKGPSKSQDFVQGTILNLWTGPI